MADSTISGLSAAATADRTFEIPVNKPGTGENAKVTLEQIIDLVSDTISNVLSVAQTPASVTSAELASVTSGINGGTGSVTSDELSAVSSQISLTNSALGSVDAHANAASAAATSVDTRLNALSQVVCVLSNVVSNEISARAASIQTLSAAVTSVDTRVNAVSQNVCVISNVLSDEISKRGASIQTLSDAVTSINNRVISILSNEISVLEAAISTTLSAVVSAVSNVSAQSAAGSATGLQNVINLLSNKICQVVAGGGLTSAQTSDMIGSVNGVNYSIRSWSATSGAANSAKGIQNVLNRISNTFSNAFSAGSILSGNVTSLQAAVASINTCSTRSVTVSTKGAQSAFNALSNTISSNYGRCRIRTTTLKASVAGTLADITGLTVAVSAGNYYEYTAKLNVAISAANTFGIGLTFPAQTAGAAGGFIQGAGSMVASAWQSTIGNIQIMAFDAAASGSIILSVVKGTVSASPVMVNAQFAPTANGNIVLQYRASASTSNVKINPGSYARVFRLVDTGQ